MIAASLRWPWNNHPAWKNVGDKSIVGKLRSKVGSNALTVGMILIRI